MSTLSHTSFFLHFFFHPTAITLVLYEPQRLLALLWQALCELFISLENCFCLSGQVSVEDIWNKYSMKKVPSSALNHAELKTSKCYLPSLPVTLVLSSLSSSVLPCQFTQQFASCATHQLTDVSFSFHILLKPWALLSGDIYTALGPSCWKSSLYWIFVTCSTRSHTLLLCIE